MERIYSVHGPVTSSHAFMCDLAGAFSKALSLAFITGLNSLMSKLMFVASLATTGRFAGQGKLRLLLGAICGVSFAMWSLVYSDDPPDTTIHVGIVFSIISAAFSTSVLVQLLQLSVELFHYPRFHNKPRRPKKTGGNADKVKEGGGKTYETLMNPVNGIRSNKRKKPLVEPIPFAGKDESRPITPTHAVCPDSGSDCPQNTLGNKSRCSSMTVESTSIGKIEKTSRRAAKSSRKSNDEKVIQSSRVSLKHSEAPNINKSKETPSLAVDACDDLPNQDKALFLFPPSTFSKTFQKLAKDNTDKKSKITEKERYGFQNKSEILFPEARNQIEISPLNEEFFDHFTRVKEPAVWSDGRRNVGLAEELSRSVLGSEMSSDVPAFENQTKSSDYLTWPLQIFPDSEKITNVRGSDGSETHFREPSQGIKQSVKESENSVVSLPESHRQVIDDRGTPDPAEWSCDFAKTENILKKSRYCALDDFRPARKLKNLSQTTENDANKDGDGISSRNLNSGISSGSGSYDLWKTTYDKEVECEIRITGQDQQRNYGNTLQTCGETDEYKGEKCADCALSSFTKDVEIFLKSQEMKNLPPLIRRFSDAIIEEKERNDPNKYAQAVDVPSEAILDTARNYGSLTSQSSTCSKAFLYEKIKDQIQNCSNLPDPCTACWDGKCTCSELNLSEDLQFFQQNGEIENLSLLPESFSSAVIQEHSNDSYKTSQRSLVTQSESTLNMFSNSGSLGLWNNIWSQKSACESRIAGPDAIWNSINPQNCTEYVATKISKNSEFNSSEGGGFFLGKGENLNFLPLFRNSSEFVSYKDSSTGTGKDELEPSALKFGNSDTIEMKREDKHWFEKSGGKKSLAQIPSRSNGVCENLFRHHISSLEVNKCLNFVIPLSSESEIQHEVEWISGSSVENNSNMCASIHQALMFENSNDTQTKAESGVNKPNEKGFLEWNTSEQNGECGNLFGHYVSSLKVNKCLNLVIPLNNTTESEIRHEIEWISERLAESRFKKCTSVQLEPSNQTNEKEFENDSGIASRSSESSIRSKFEFVNLFCCHISPLKIDERSSLGIPFSNITASEIQRETELIWEGSGESHSSECCAFLPQPDDSTGGMESKNELFFASPSWNAGSSIPKKIIPNSNGAFTDKEIFSVANERKIIVADSSASDRDSQTPFHIFLKDSDVSFLRESSPNRCVAPQKEISYPEREFLSKWRAEELEKDETDSIASAIRKIDTMFIYGIY